MRFVTYNLLNDHPKFEGISSKHWPDRRPHLIAHLRQLAPEVLAIQEGRPTALADVQAAFPDWELVGDWAGGPYGGEYIGLFYDRRHWACANVQTIWLSPTPTLPSMGWDARHYRVLVSVELRHRATGQAWHCWVTHLDAAGARARLEGMAVILDRLRAQLERDPDSRLLLAGDFNARVGSPVYRRLAEQGVLQDAFHRAPSKPPRPHYTFSGVDARWTWQRLALHLFYPHYMHRRIDHVWVAPAVQVQHYHISDWKYDQSRYYPSDHLPIVVDVVSAT